MILLFLLKLAILPVGLPQSVRFSLSTHDSSIRAPFHSSARFWGLMFTEIILFRTTMLTALVIADVRIFLLKKYLRIYVVFFALPLRNRQRQATREQRVLE